MRNILFVTSLYPYPAEATGGTHTINKLICAIKDAKIDIFYYDKKSEEVRFSKNINKIYYDCLLVKEKTTRIKSIICCRTFTTEQYKHSSHLLEELLGHNEYDIVVYDQMSSIYLNRNNRAKNILFMADSMPLHFERKLERCDSILEKAYYFLQARFAVREERNQYKYYDKIVYVSSTDLKYESKIHSQFATKMSTMNVGIDIQEIDESIKLDLLSPSLIFTGNMSYSPNEDAMIWFVLNIFPEIQKNNPEVKLYIVGINPTEKLISTCNNIKNIVITGRVDNIYGYIKSADIYISPLQYGSGKRNKIVEAMACGKAIIASPVSMEGFDDITIGEDVLLAHDSKEWISMINMLLVNDELKSKLESNAKEKINTNYDWSFIASGLLK